MKTLKKILLPGLLLLISCTSSRITSFRDPDLPPAAYSKFLVVSNLKYEYMQDFERIFSRIFNHNDIELIYFWRLFPPLKTYDSSYVEKTILKTGADAFLLVTFDDIADTVIVPGFSSTYDFGWLNTKVKNPMWSQTSTTISTPAHKSVSYTRSITTEIYSTSKKEKVWVAFYSSDIGKPELLFDDYSRATVSALQKDSVVAN